MDHHEYIRVVEGSRTAVLMIHGIAGTPAHFRTLIPVIPEDCSVYNILLDGHGKTVEDLGSSSMEIWKTQVDVTLKKLISRHEQIVLVAHSMGTLFAIRSAIRYPDRIRGLFLLAVPFRPRLRMSTVRTYLRVVRGNIRPDDTAARAMIQDTGVQLDRRLWKYITWAPRYLELLREIRQVRHILRRLSVPCETFQSWTDELVSVRSCRDLEGHPYIRSTILRDSGHFAYGPEDMKLLQNRLSDMLERVADDTGESMSRITFHQIQKLFSFETQGKNCVEIDFWLAGSEKFDCCCMGKLWSPREKRVVYWYGLTPDGENAYDFHTFEDMADAPVFDGMSLREVWDRVVLDTIDGCVPKERIRDYIGNV